MSVVAVADDKGHGPIARAPSAFPSPPSFTMTRTVAAMAMIVVREGAAMLLSDCGFTDDFFVSIGCKVEIAAFIMILSVSVAGKSFVLVGCAVRLAVAVMAALFAWRIGRLALLAVRLSNLEVPGLPVVTATWETAVAEVLVSILRSTSFCLGEPNHHGRKGRGQQNSWVQHWCALDRLASTFSCRTSVAAD